MGNRPRAFIKTALLLFAGAAVFPVTTTAQAKLHTVAGIPPIAWAVDQVGGELVDVDVLLPSGTSPETYSPTPQTLTGLSDARILFTVGVVFEQRITERVRDFAKEIRIVDVTSGIALRYFEDEHHHHDNGHGSADPHVWLDPKTMCTIVANIATSLSAVDSENNDYYRTRADSVVSRLHKLDNELIAILAPFKGRSILVYHPSFGYFTDRYGLNQVAIERHGKEASARQLGELISQAKRDKIGVLFTQPQFPRRQAEVLAGEVGATVSVVDPLSRDYIAMMQDLGHQFAQSFGDSAVSR